MRGGRLRIKKDSRSADEMLKVQWIGTSSGNRKISNTFHSDVLDALLYAYREAKHWLNRYVEEPQDDGFVDDSERRAAERAQRKKGRRA